MISSAALMLALTIAGCDKNEEPKVPANPETPGTPTAPADRPIIFTTAIAATRFPQLEADAGLGFHDDPLHQVVEQALVKSLQTLRPALDQVRCPLKGVDGVIDVLILQQPAR